MPEISAKDRIIFALDVPTVDEAVKYARLLKDSVGVFKIGLQLFVAEGPAVVEAVREAAPGCGIFLDLKFHDIPATVEGAMRSAATIGADFITVHCEEGSAMLRAAVEKAGNTKVLGVTVLTSMAGESLAEAGIDPKYGERATDLVLHRARIARVAGCAGVVCSGLEARSVRKEFGGDLLIITPGIRGREDVVGDQKRVATPYNAVKDGADYIVVGRPIRNADDPVEAAARIAEDVQRGLEARG